MRVLVAPAVLLLVVAACGGGPEPPDIDAALMEHVRAEVPEVEHPRVVVAEEVADGIAVGTAFGDEAAYAATFRRTEDEWLLDDRAGPRVEPLAPAEGARIDGTIDVTVRAPPGADVSLWIGEGALMVERAGDGVFHGSVEEPLRPGMHVATAVALEGDRATAVAWTFEVG